MSQIESLKSLITDEFFREIAKSSFDVAAIFEASGNPIWANAKWRSIFGELFVKAKPFADVHPDDVERVTAIWKGLVDDKEVSSQLTYRFSSPSGDYMYFDATAVRAQVNSDILISVTARNVTPQRLLEEELEDENKRNEKLLKIISSRNERMAEMQEQINEKSTEK
jgi:hypothetical protein